MSHEATYARIVEQPEIMIQGAPDHTGGVLWEFGVRWHRLGSDTPGSLTPRLEVFHDAWEAFTEPEVRQFLDWLARQGAQRKKPQSPDVVEVLLSLGFQDVTERP